MKFISAVIMSALLSHANSLEQTTKLTTKAPLCVVDYNFNGVSDQLRIEPRPVENDFSFAFWVKTTQAGKGKEQWHEGFGIIDGEVGGGTNDFGVSLMAGGLIGFGTGKLHDDKTFRSLKSVNDDEWHHVAVTRNSKTMDVRIYIDGDLNVSGKGNSGALNAPQRITVGSLQTNLNYFKG